MVKTFDKNAQRMKRHTRVRGKISGTPERPRLNVYRSNANIYAQIIDDVSGVTLAAAASNEKDFEGATGNKEAARKVGKLVAERAKAKGIDTVVFDRTGRRPLMIVEYKAPHIAVSQRTFDQIARYNIVLKTPWLVVSNGMNHYCCRVDSDAGTYSFVDRLPTYSDIAGAAR